jgi:hypothetical protein
MSVNNVDHILQRIRLSHIDWVDSFAEHHPGVAEVMQRHSSRPQMLLNYALVRLFLLFAWILMRMRSKQKPARYVFQGLRYLSLIESLPATEVLILGGRRELRLCLQRGYKFHWIGYLAKSFELYRWGDEENLFPKVVNYIQTVFETDDGENRYLFLWEDSQPVGVTLSNALASIPRLSIVCIAHGMFLRYKGARALPPEGKHCKFNFVWSDSQRRLVKGGDDPCTFVLGLPYNVKVSSSVRHAVVIVGHCGREFNKEEYFYSYYHFTKIFSLLDRAGFEVSFRPHPTDDINFAHSNFSVINTEEKQQLFSRGRMVFIGIASSLMYEARQSGNVVIALDTPQLTYYVDFNVDHVIKEDDYKELPLYLSGLMNSDLMKREINTEPLASRLERCIRKIDNFNAKGDLI